MFSSSKSKSLVNDDIKNFQGPINLKLVIVGDSTVGKTTFLYALTYKEFREYIRIFDNYNLMVKYRGKNVSIGLWDTAGQDDYVKLRPLSYPETSVFLIAYDCMNPISFENVLLKWYPEIKKHCPNTPCVVVSMKSDLRPNEKNKMNGMYITEKEGREMAKEIGVDEFVSCSSKELKNLDEVVNIAVKNAIISANLNLHKKKGKKKGIHEKQKMISFKVEYERKKEKNEQLYMGELPWEIIGTLITYFSTSEMFFKFVTLSKGFFEFLKMNPTFCKNIRWIFLKKNRKHLIPKTDQFFVVNLQFGTEYVNFVNKNLDVDFKMFPNLEKLVIYNVFIVAKDFSNLSNVKDLTISIYSNGCFGGLFEKEIFKKFFQPILKKVKNYTYTSQMFQDEISKLRNYVGYKKLKNLKYLHLKGNVVLSTEIMNCSTGLKKINFEKNSQTKKNFNEHKKLEELSFGSSKLFHRNNNCLPVELKINDLKYLRKLYIWSVSLLNNHTPYNIDSLEELKISQSVIPDNIFMFINLKILAIHHCDKFDRCVFQNCQRIEFLKMTNVKTVNSEDLRVLKHLEIISIEYCMLLKLNDILNLNVVESISYLGTTINNEIINKGGENSLKKLELSLSRRSNNNNLYCHFEDFSKKIAKIKSLEVLEIRLMRLQVLFETKKNCNDYYQNLKRIKFDNINFINKNVFIKQCRNLQFFIVIGGTNVTSINIEGSKLVEEFYLYNNTSIQNITIKQSMIKDMSIKNCSKIQKIYGIEEKVDKLFIESCSVFDEFLELKSLSKLHISKCYNIEGKLLSKLKDKLQELTIFANMKITEDCFLMLNNLTKLDLEGLSKVIGIGMNKSKKQLHNISILHLKKMRRLQDNFLTYFTNVQELIIDCCPKITGSTIVQQRLSKVEILNCFSFQKQFADELLLKSVTKKKKEKKKIIKKN